MYKIFFKRILDFIAALIGFILLSPVFFVVMIGLFFANQGKPFFFQTRPGKNERLFNIIKFKTMNDKKDSKGALLPDSDRLTKIGAFVRKTSLDEIPQLLNVLKGDMSLIGPRPLLIQYLPLYNNFQKKRHSIRPGITGWAQINGRDEISIDENIPPTNINNNNNNTISNKTNNNRRPSITSYFSKQRIVKASSINIHEMADVKHKTNFRP